MGIQYNKKNRTFYLESKNTSYVFSITDNGYLNHLYYGKTIANDDLAYSIKNYDRGFSANFYGAKDRSISLDTMNNEYPTYGTGDYRESAVLLKFQDGNRLSNFKYLSHEILQEKPRIKGMPSCEGKETLAITMEDKLNSINLKLYYTVYDTLPIILRRAEIINGSNCNIQILRAYSFSIDIKNEDYSFLNLHGKHCGERQIQISKLVYGDTSISSARGASSHQQNPFLAILSKNASEYNGEVYGFNLVYSGSFKMSMSIDQFNILRIKGGINDFDSGFILEQGKTFATPEVVMCYSDSGLCSLSNSFHDLYRKHLIQKIFVGTPRPIIINSWESVYFNFNTEKLFEIIDSVKDTGIDTFVLDDGWFGKRDDDNSGLGDWIVNETKLKGGLKTIIDRCKKNGLKFGLWFEPEMISYDSDLFKNHPDWYIHHTSHNATTSRNQLVLDITNKAALRYIKAAVSKILEENDITYVKWDMNRHLTENYSVSLNPSQQQELHHRYILAVYDICEYLTNKFPYILFEGCSGGGGRFDPAMLYYFPQYWTSDNSDAISRCRIQYGTSICYPLSCMVNHISVCPNHQTGRVIPFQTRGNVALNSTIGYELNPKQLSEEEKKQIKKQTIEYRNIESLILEGDYFRLSDPFTQNDYATLVVSKDKSSAFFTYVQFLSHANPEIKYIRLHGLDENRTYRIIEKGLLLHGSTLINLGLPMDWLWGDFSSICLNIIAE